ncbi:GMC oxred N domain containing protein, partial [Asbolus verrucosus]
STEDIYQSELVRAFVKGGNELGLPHIDYNANFQSFGVSTVQATVLRGRRHSNARAFLHPVKHRPNLHIVTSAYVTKLLIDPTNKEAYGVEYERFGKTYRVGAVREVILSAGTFNSPQLLMLAGIGPQEHLQELGIPVLQDLPVGQNLHDHLAYVGLHFLLDKEVSLSAYNLMTSESISDFLKNGTGPYTSLGGVEGIGYIKTELSQDPEDIPDIELIFVGASLSTDYGIFTRTGMNIRDDIYDGLFRPTHNIPSWTIFPMLLHPKSTGYLKLHSRSPYDYPLLYGNYFTD